MPRKNTKFGVLAPFPFQIPKNACSGGKLKPADGFSGFILTTKCEIWVKFLAHGLQLTQALRFSDSETLGEILSHSHSQVNSHLKQ